MIDLELTSSRIHETAVEKGFWGDPVLMDKIMAKLALVHSEITEVLEALRKNKGKDKVTEEICDAHIRLFDLYAFLIENDLCAEGLEEYMLEKMGVNDNRPALHGHRWG